jgi:hypothetical protein
MDIEVMIYVAFIGIFAAILGIKTILPFFIFKQRVGKPLTILANSIKGSIKSKIRLFGGKIVASGIFDGAPTRITVLTVGAGTRGYYIYLELDIPSLLELEISKESFLNIDNKIGLNIIRNLKEVKIGIPEFDNNILVKAKDSEKCKNYLSDAQKQSFLKEIVLGKEFSLQLRSDKIVAKRQASYFALKEILSFDNVADILQKMKKINQ